MSVGSLQTKIRVLRFKAITFNTPAADSGRSCGLLQEVEQVIYSREPDHPSLAPVELDGAAGSGSGGRCGATHSRERNFLELAFGNHAAFDEPFSLLDDHAHLRRLNPKLATEVGGRTWPVFPGPMNGQDHVVADVLQPPRFPCFESIESFFQDR